VKQRRRNETERKALENRLFEAILKLESIAECRNFFVDLCTPAEVEALSDRWEVVRMLMKKESYRTIAEKTGVSLTTIGRVARFLHGPHAGYKSVLIKTGEWKDD
jgi:TrpR-related protein YerC/YecD